MFRVNLDQVMLDVKQEPSKEKLSDVARILFGSHIPNMEAIKVIPWAMQIKEKNYFIADKSDLDKLKESINQLGRENKLANYAVYAMLNAIENAVKEEPQTG